MELPEPKITFIVVTKRYGRPQSIIGLCAHETLLQASYTSLPRIWSTLRVGFCLFAPLQLDIDNRLLLFRINDGKGNCKAGVAVDTGVTQPFVHNFYLQSHAAIQGSECTHVVHINRPLTVVFQSASRSSHYIVLHDDIFDTDILV